MKSTSTTDYLKKKYNLPEMTGINKQTDTGRLQNKRYSVRHKILTDGAETGGRCVFFFFTNRSYRWDWDHPWLSKTLQIQGGTYKEIYRQIHYFVSFKYIYTRYVNGWKESFRSAHWAKYYRTETRTCAAIVHKYVGYGTFGTFGYGTHVPNPIQRRRPSQFRSYCISTDLQYDTTE